MKKTISFLIVLCVIFSFGLISSAAESAWWPESLKTEAISDDLRETVFSRYLQYEYGVYLQTATSNTPMTFEEFTAFRASLDTPVTAESVKCLGISDNQYVFHIGPEGIYPGIGSERLGDYNFNIMLYGGTGSLYYYSEQYTAHAFMLLTDAYAFGRIDDAFLDRAIGTHIQDLLPLAARVEDVNRDGILSVSDIVELRQIILTGYADAEYDIDGDGAVSVSDVIALREMIVA